MKRKDIINRLIKEGFTEKTLVNLSDKQLTLLSQRVISEESEVLIPKEKLDTPEAQNLKNKKEIIRTYENDESVGNDDMFIPSGENDSADELMNWVEKLSEQKLKKESVSNMTTKGSIMEIIKRKIHEYGTEKETITAPPKTKPSVRPKTDNPFKPDPLKNPKPKAKSNVPEFMTYDSIKSTEKETITAPPKTKPGTKPDKLNPFKPDPLKNPKPKAGIKKLNEKKK